MKKLHRIFAAAATVVLFASCVHQLDTLPLNETDFTSELAYKDKDSYIKGLAYINAYYSFVSQGDPGNSDLSFSDAGQSELVRQYINLNELSCDSFKCVWGDSYVSDIQYNKWTTAVNDATEAVYTRCLKGIALVNEFLLQTEDAKLEARGHSDVKGVVAGYRAEARFHRAMFFYLLMDFFGNPPFPMPENIGGDMPEQINRVDLYNWIESECLDILDGDMPEKGEVPYPRPTKGSVEALLARMYLNAEVYTGTPQWQKAKDFAKDVIDMGYGLNPNYEDNFFQDNTETGAAENEFIFAIEYDKDRSQSWGGPTTLTSAAMDDESSAKVASLLGLSSEHVMVERWNGYHVAHDYVARFDLKEVDWSGEGFGYNRETSDKRAFFINEGEKEFDNSDVATGWRCWKFSSRYSDGHVNGSEVDNYKFSSCDFPIFRLPEMYLIYAEAEARLGDGTVTSSEATGYIKALRDRAGVGMPDTITLDFLLDERARELMWEGHRRVDLIRYGYFTAASFPWTLKGGIADGKIAIPEYMTIYPIIMTDMNANSKLVQNPGY